MNGITDRQALLDMDDGVPVIPRWVMEWGWVAFTICVVIYCFIAVAAGHAYGADAGWGLFLAAVLGAVLLLSADYARRLSSARVGIDQALYEQLEIAKLRVIGGRGLEDYWAICYAPAGTRTSYGLPTPKIGSRSTSRPSLLTGGLPSPLSASTGPMTNSART